MEITKGRFWASLVSQAVKDLPAMLDTQVQSLGRGDPLEKELVIYYTILAWWIPWTGDPDGLQFMASKRVRHNWATTHTLEDLFINFCEFVRPGWVWKTTPQNKIGLLWLFSDSLGASRNSPRNGTCHFMYLLGVLVDVKWQTKKSVPLVSSAEVTLSWGGSPHLGLGNWVQEAMPPGKPHQFITLHIHPGILWWLRW